MVIESLVALLIAALVIGLVASLIVYLIRYAPFIPAEMKQWLEWLVIAIAVLAFVLRALPLLGVAIV